MKPDPKQLEKICEICEHQNTEECPGDPAECPRFENSVKLTYPKTYPLTYGIKI